jgi:hypothetical protein
MRRLVVKKETLTQLTAVELGEVVGGTMPTKFDCTESHQVCDPGVTREICAYSVGRCALSYFVECIPTQGC